MKGKGTRMARQKAKKKSDIDVKDEVVSKHTDKKVAEDTPPANTKKVQAATKFDEMWTPKPDMGEVKPPADENLQCECGHKKKMHYGSQHNWCNEANCRCAAWTQA